MKKKKGPAADLEVVRYRGDSVTRVTDVVAREVPLEIRLNGDTVAHLTRLPGDEVLLALGFCYSEGLIRRPGDVDQVLFRTAGSGTVQPEAAEEATVTAAEPQDVVEVLCGQLPAQTRDKPAEVVSDQRYSHRALIALPGAVGESQLTFNATGGTHGAALFGSEGEVLTVKEDVGRHNAVDKVIGFMLDSGLPPGDKGLMLTGRLSFEMVRKAARAGLPIICSVSAPTSLGIEEGINSGVTVVGFLRGSSFNVYSHPWRLGDA